MEREDCQVTTDDRRKPIISRYWLLVAVVSALCLIHLGGYRPLTHHEVLVAQTAREMLDAGDWLRPRYYGESRFQKPPLAYWEVMTCFWLTGSRSEWTARLPSALAGIGLVLVVAFLGSRIHSRRVGLLAGFVQATMVYFLIHARLAEVDITLTLTVALAILGYTMLVPGRRSGNRIFIVGFWLATGTSVLAKGPVGPLMIFGVVLTHAALSGRLRQLRILAAPIGLVLFLVLSFGWPLAILLIEPESWRIWVRETWGRFLQDPGGVTRPVFYYPWAVVWLTLPWSPIWISALVGRSRSWLRQGLRRQNSDSLWLCWLVVPMVLLSFSAGKQEHYLIPALVPCSILTAGALDDWLSIRRDRDRWFRMALAALVLGILLVQSYVLPRVHGRRLAANWIREATAKIDPDLPIIALGHPVQWLCFYVELPMKRVDSLEEFLDRHASRNQWVLATAVERPTLMAHCRILEMLQAPPDPRIANSKTPILFRIAPKSDPIRGARPFAR